MTAVAVARAPRRPAWRPALGLLVLAIVAALPAALSPYGLSVAVTVCFYVVLAEAWNLFSGYTGYVNFGSAGFIGLGAYGCAVMIWKFGWPWPAALAAAAVVPTAVSLVALPALRVRGAYFAIAMLGFAETARVLCGSKYLEPVTNGSVGIPLTPGLGITGLFYLMAATAAATVAVTYAVARGEAGLRLLAIRENEAASRVLGIETTWYKGAALLTSAALTGVAGGIFAIFLAYIEPDAVFSASLTLQTMLMAAFGGLGTVFGPVVGAVLLTLVIQALSTYLLQWDFVVVGAVLIAIVLLIPEGVLPRLQRRFAHWRHRGL
jgi:branched-chain amino acid transport system permease protein